MYYDLSLDEDNGKLSILYGTRRFLLLLSRYLFLN